MEPPAPAPRVAVQGGPHARRPRLRHPARRRHHRARDRASGRRRASQGALPLGAGAVPRARAARRRSLPRADLDPGGAPDPGGGLWPGIRRARSRDGPREPARPGPRRGRRGPCGCLGGPTRRAPRRARPPPPDPGAAAQERRSAEQESRIKALERERAKFKDLADQEKARADDWKDRALNLAVRVGRFAEGVGGDEED